MWYCCTPPSALETFALPETPVDDADTKRATEPTAVDGPDRSDRSTKWISRSTEPSGRGTVVVNPASAVITDSFPASPVNFVMIFGPARCGKSFLMNALARRDNIFEVSPAVVPCTSGVDLSKTVVSLDEFMGAASSGEADSMPCVGFVDVEGLGDKDPAHHVKLAIPPMLVSKVRKTECIPLASCWLFSTEYHSK